MGTLHISKLGCTYHKLCMRFEYTVHPVSIASSHTAAGLLPFTAALRGSRVKYLQDEAQTGQQAIHMALLRMILPVHCYAPCGMPECHIIDADCVGTREVVNDTCTPAATTPLSYCAHIMTDGCAPLLSAMPMWPTKGSTQVMRGIGDQVIA
jgi:hypothetical protein